MTDHNRAVFYIASKDDGGRFIAEAAESAESARRVLGLPVYLFTDYSRPIESPYCDYIMRLPEQRGPFWYLDQVRYWNYAVDHLRQYDQLLYLDVDTYVAHTTASMIFDVLDRFDFAAGQSASRDVLASAYGAPESFCAPQIGVNVFRNDEAMRGFFAYWLALYEEHQARYDNDDEAALRDALWMNKPGIRWHTLAPEFALRFDFGCWVKGWVRFLHGRVGGISTNRVPLGPVAEQINKSCVMRMWKGALLEGI